MYYKLSNKAERKQIEDLFDVTFKYPNLYRPETVINGLEESNLPVIIMEEPNAVLLAIWGMLPEKYQDDWQQFQNLTNTLNIDERNLQTVLWQSEALKDRRCLILATGFFTSVLKNGMLHHYEISLKTGKPFFLAGIYNTLDDGFITCSLLLSKANSAIENYQNIVDSMPIVISKEKQGFWLNNENSFAEIKYFLANTEQYPFKASPISEDFFDQNKAFNSVLQLVETDQISRQIQL